MADDFNYKFGEALGLERAWPYGFVGGGWTEESNAELVRQQIAKVTPDTLLDALITASGDESLSALKGTEGGRPQFREALHKFLSNPEAFKALNSGSGDGKLDLSQLGKMAQDPAQLGIITTALNNAVDTPAGMAHFKALTTAFADPNNIDFKAANTALVGLGVPQDDIIRFGLQHAGLSEADTTKIMGALDQHPEFKKTLMGAMLGNEELGLEGDPSILKGLATMAGADATGGAFSVDKLIETLGDDTSRKTLQDLIAAAGKSATDDINFETITKFGTAVEKGEFALAAGLLEKAGVAVPANLAMGAKLDGWSAWLDDLSQRDDFLGSALRGIFQLIADIIGPDSTIGQFLKNTLGIDVGSIAGRFERSASLRTISPDAATSVGHQTDTAFTAAFNEKAFENAASMTREDFIAKFKGEFERVVPGARDEMRGLDAVPGIREKFGSMATMTAAEIEEAALRMYREMRDGQTLTSSANALTAGG